MNTLLITFFISYGLYAFFNNFKFWIIYILLIVIYYYLTQYKLIDQTKEKISRKISLSTWSTSYDPQTYLSLKLDITKIIPYLKKKSEEIKEHLTPTIFTIKLMAIILKKYPEVYGYINFGKYETKESVDICCLVQVGGGHELANTTIIGAEKKNFKQITEELVNSVKLLRDRKNKEQNKKMKLYKLIPTFIMGPISHILAYLSSIGIKLKIVGLKKFEFGSCVITSVGSIGIEDSYAPIPPVTFAPLLLTLCSKYDVNKRKEDGKIETKTYLKMNFTGDYRFFDYRTTLEIFKDIHRIGSDPEIFEQECRKYGNTSI